MNEPGMNLLFEEIDCQETFCYKVYTPTKQKYLGEIIFDISCGWVYLTDEEQVGSMGFWDSPFLRAIADKLDELNAALFKGMWVLKFELETEDDNCWMNVVRDNKSYNTNIGNISRSIQGTHYLFSPEECVCLSVEEMVTITAKMKEMENARTKAT